MTETHDVNPANLPHQVEESDRISMLGAFRMVGLLVMMCALVQFICIFIPHRLDDDLWTLKTPPSGTGSPQFSSLAAFVFLPAPNATPFGTQSLRVTIRLFLCLLAICYFVLAGALIKATDGQLNQLNSGKMAVIEQRQDLFEMVLNGLKTSSSYEELNGIFPMEKLNLGNISGLTFEEYRSKVVNRLIEMNNSTLKMIEDEAKQNESATITYYLRKILRSSIFSLAFFLVALAAPRGFPAPLPAHEQQPT